MLQFFLGSLFGGTIGVAVMCFCTSASESDDKQIIPETPINYHES